MAGPGKRGPAKGSPRRGGRQKGTPNKLTADVKQAIEKAFKKAGGEDYLARQADENPTAFMTLLGKLLPTQVTGDPDNPVVTRIETVVVDAGDGDG